MRYIFIYLLILLSNLGASQNTFDAIMQRKHMKKDLQKFYDIREVANSGVYKYRTKAQIDSIYQWAYEEIESSTTLGDFYNIICKITDFEGSAHNTTYLPEKVDDSIDKEAEGYFPFMIKLVEEHWVCNNSNIAIPMGSRIVRINGVDMNEIIPKLYKYYTTDGFNITGKQLGINFSFPWYYRMNYGKQDQFKITYIDENNTENTLTVKSISFEDYHKQRAKRHSKSSDYLYYSNPNEFEESGGLYYSNILNDSTAILTINSFAIGWGAGDPVHKKYVNFLDSIFTQFKYKSIKHLIVDVRYNAGGTGPNDIETVSFLVQKPLNDVKQAWVSCGKLPNVGMLDIPWYQKPFVNFAIRKEVRCSLVQRNDGRFFYEDFQIVEPKQNVFSGTVYLLISPRTASAATLFGAAVAGNTTNTIIIGEETLGGYYGHNGILPISYVLPKSKISFGFSVVNLDQNVPQKTNQPFGSGIRPNFEIKQSYADFLNNEDTVMKFTMNLIKTKKNGSLQNIDVN